MEGLGEVFVLVDHAHALTAAPLRRLDRHRKAILGHKGLDLLGIGNVAIRAWDDRAPRLYCEIPPLGLVTEDL